MFHKRITGSISWNEFSVIFVLMNIGQLDFIGVGWNWNSILFHFLHLVIPLEFTKSHQWWNSTFFCINDLNTLSKPYYQQCSIDLCLLLYVILFCFIGFWCSMKIYQISLFCINDLHTPCYALAGNVVAATSYSQFIFNEKSFSSIFKGQVFRF